MTEQNVQDSAETSQELGNDSGVSQEQQKIIDALQAQLAEKDKIISETRNEAAKHRIGKREAAETASTLEERLKELEENFHRKEVEAQRLAVANKAGISPNLLPLLGDDPETFERNAELLKSHAVPAGGADEPLAPKGVEKVSGGLTPRDEGADFDPAKILKEVRGR